VRELEKGLIVKYLYCEVRLMWEDMMNVGPIRSLVVVAYSWIEVV